MIADGNNFPLGQQPNMYGAAPFNTKTETRRQIRLDMGILIQCIFVPWLLFSIIFATASFSVHYFHRSLANVIVFLGFLFAIMNLKLARDAVKKQHRNDAAWMVFYGVACFMAWSTGFALGDKNFQKNTEPFYTVSNLNSYPQIDPSVVPGQQVMDAGRMKFVPGTQVDITRYMAFHNKETYCVAPVINPNSKSTASYDYWAAGMNCCDGHKYVCGEYNNPLARQGLRVMKESQRNFFRLAVQQAEAAYSINAKHPLFIYWMQDPDSELGAYLDEGFSVYIYSMCGCFMILLGAVVVFAVAVSKM